MQVDGPRFDERSCEGLVATQADSRDNVIVEDLCFRDSIMDSHGPESAKSGGLVSVNKDKTFYPVYNPLGARLFDAEVLRKKEHWEHVSIMNVILMRSNAYLEREKFGTLVLKSVSQLLRKEAGLCVQKQAMHLLYLLLNSPNLLVIFCSGCKEEMKGAEDENNDAKMLQLSENLVSYLMAWQIVWHAVEMVHR
ncbi:hypothetical protein AAG906_021809 [Vitis piasezkii]